MVAREGGGGSLATSAPFPKRFIATVIKDYVFRRCSICYGRKVHRHSLRPSDHVITSEPPPQESCKALLIKVIFNHWQMLF